MNEVWRDGNKVELLINGEEFFPRVFDSIRDAKHEVLLETFIFNQDRVGRALQRALIDAAERGVRVDVTVDDYGSANFSQDFINEMVTAGVNLHVFDPTPRVLGARINVFRRLHRKIVVIDNNTAFVGGINYVSDHLTDYGPTAKQDYAVQLWGPIVQDVRQASLQLLEASVSKEKYTWEKLPAHGPQENGDARILLVVRDNIQHKSDIEQQYIAAIKNAKQRIIIANAYFFPGYRLLKALRKAAKRGVEVRLILQGRPDMPWVSACTRLLYGYLLSGGVVIHEYCKRPLHGKVAIVDDTWSTVGSSNLDPLSLALNLEANVIIDNASFNQKLAEHLHSLASAQCKPVDIVKAKRGWWRMPFIFLGFHFLRYFPAMAGWLPVHSPKIQLVSVEAEAEDADLKVSTRDVNRPEVKDILPKTEKRYAEKV